MSTDHSVASAHARAAPLVDLLRHGEPVGGQRFRGRLDDPLSETGWAQMTAAIGEAPPWQGIITSPLRRCADFARELAGQHDLPLHIEPRWQEINFGAWEGLTVNDLWQSVPEQIAAYWQDPTQFTPPQAEPLQALQARVIAAWQALLPSLQPGSHWLVITHGGVIRVLLAHVLGLPLQYCLRLEIGLAQVSRIRLQTAPGTAPIGSIVFHAREHF